MSREVENFKVLRKGLKFYAIGKCYEEEISAYLYHDIKQSLQQPTLQELREEIISELNEFYQTEEIKWKYDKQLQQFSWANVLFINDKNLIPSSNLPLTLAHKITTYFIRSEEE